MPWKKSHHENHADETVNGSPKVWAREDDGAEQNHGSHTKISAMPAEQDRDLARSPLRNLLSKYCFLDVISDPIDAVIDSRDSERLSIVTDFDMVGKSWRFQHTVSSFTRNTGLVDPQLQDGKVRIKWRCKCGRKLYDDYIEQRPGAAVELEKLLNGNNEHAPASGREHSSGGDLDRWSSSTLQSMRASHEHLQTAAKAKLKSSSRAYDPRPKEGEEATTVIDCDPESRWLLVCAKAQERPTSLSHLDICSTSTDKELFDNLRKAYLTLKSKWSHWFSLSRVQSIRFVQFELHIKDFVDIRKVPDMPPENKRDEYLYQPCDLIPPVGENLMAHLFHHPEDANERSITFLRAPKKRKAKLTVCPQRGTSVGWGIHLVEGWVMSRLWLLSLAMFVLGSLVFGICWAVLRHDVQGAFGVAAYMVALVGLVVGTIQAGLS